MQWMTLVCVLAMYKVRSTKNLQHLSKHLRPWIKTMDLNTLKECPGKKNHSLTFPDQVFLYLPPSAGHQINKPTQTSSLPVIHPPKKPYGDRMRPCQAMPQLHLLVLSLPSIGDVLLHPVPEGLQIPPNPTAQGDMFRTMVMNGRWFWKSQRRQFFL